MKSIKILLALLLSCGAASAQSFAEWFKQGSTQKKYLLEQIAALQVYGSYLQKGYRIAQTGLGSISAITHGEFGLHSAFFDALKAVSPVVRDNTRVAEIIGLELSVIKAFGAIKNAPVHTAYIAAVSAAVTADCLSDLSELLLVITSGKVEMGDAGRLQRLDAIAGRMRNKAAFSQAFCNQVRWLLTNHEHELEELRSIGRWYEDH